MVVNTMIAAMAKLGGGTATVSRAHVYHVTSSTVNPMLIGDQLRFMYQHFSRSPLLDIAGRPILVQPASTLGSMELYVRFVQSNTLLREGSTETEGMSTQKARTRLRAKAMVEQIIHLSGIYEPYTFFQGRFDSTNTEALFEEMSAQERERFHFDMRSIDCMYSGKGSSRGVSPNPPGKHVYSHALQLRRLIVDPCKLLELRAI